MWQSDKMIADRDPFGPAAPSASTARLRTSLWWEIAIVLSLVPVTQAIGFDRVDGLLGYELFRRFAVRIDYAAGRITFTRPRALRTPPAGPRVPFTLRGRVPKIEAVVDSVPGDGERQVRLIDIRPSIQRADQSAGIQDCADRTHP